MGRFCVFGHATLHCTTMYTLIKKTQKEHSEIELSVEIPASEIDRQWQGAIEELKANISMAGFRDGKVPDAIVLDRVGEEGVLEKAARRALNKVFPALLEAEKIEVIAAPNIELGELKKGEPVTFTATVATMPTVTLPDYQALAKEVLTKRTHKPVADEDVTTFLNGIRRQRALAVKKAEHEGKGMSAEDLAKIEVSEDEYPAIDEAFIKTLGSFADVDDFMKQVRTHLEEESLARHNQTVRADIIEAIVDKTTVDLPEILIEQELDKMEHQFKADIKNMGLDFNTYLEALKKDMAAMRTDWRDNARKRAVANMVLPEIAHREKIAPDMAQVETEAAHVMQQVKDADPARTKLYVYSVLMNEKVFEFLEGKEVKKMEPHVHDEHCGHEH